MESRPDYACSPQALRPEDTFVETKSDVEPQLAKSAYDKDRLPLSSRRVWVVP